jgi:hypothetical protein
MCVGFLVQYTKRFYKRRYLTNTSYDYFYRCVNYVTLGLITGLGLGLRVGVT